MQKFIFVDNKAELADAWKKEFAQYDNVEVHGPVDIFSFEADACVSPANSFGFMTGGIDLLYSMNMGWNVMARLQNIIQTEYNGELLVGQALLLPTNYDRFPNIIVAPTMRMPDRLNGTQNVYLAAKAIFHLAKTHPVLKTIICPGLGTGTGAVTPKECARLMRMAYEDWYLGNAETNGVMKPGSLGEVFAMCDRQTSKTETDPVGEISAANLPIKGRFYPEE